MKKLFSVLLAFVFFYSIVGFYLNFAIEQCRIKEEIKEKIIKQLPDYKLTIIKISSRDQRKIQWIEDGKEFRFEGNMYDVVKVRQGGDTILYYCFCDIKENRLLSNLDKLVKDQSDHSPPRTVQKKQQINIFFHQVLLLNCFNEAPVHYLNPSSGYKFQYNEVLSPPPKVLNAIS
jgi:hypothetical protein